jgi:hypothetical protein
MDDPSVKIFPFFINFFMKIVHLIHVLFNLSPRHTCITLKSFLFLSISQRAHVHSIDCNFGVTGCWESDDVFIVDDDVDSENSSPSEPTGDKNGKSPK